MKICTGCGATKPLTDFHRCGRSPGGHKARCKDCRCRLTRDWYAKNSATARASSKRWREANPELFRIYRRRWAEQNPDEQKAAEKRWELANRERRYAGQKAWREAHPERTRDYRYRRIAERTETPETTARIAQLLTEPCAYCDSTVDITIDHIVPLSRGGTHTPDNLAPACQPCNSSKNSKSLVEWLTG